MKQAETDAASASVAFLAFQQQFEVLEKQMAQQSSAIEKDAQAMIETVQGDASRTLVQVGLALALALAVLLFAALWLSKALARPMAYAVRVADELAPGNLSMPIQPEGNEQMAAAAGALNRQAEEPVQLVAVFQLAEDKNPAQRLPRRQ